MYPYNSNSGSSNSLGCHCICSSCCLRRYKGNNTKTNTGQHYSSLIDTFQRFITKKMRNNVTVSDEISQTCTALYTEA